MSSSIVSDDMLKVFRSKVIHFGYLEERGWFMMNPELQAKLLQVINLGLGLKVDVVSPDFSDHLDELINEGMSTK